MRLTFEEAYELRAKESYEKGEADGQLNTCRTLLRRLLENRFGPLSNKLRRQIEASGDIEHLRTRFDQALDISSSDELTI